MVLKLLALRGMAGIPVAAGAQKPIMGHVPVYWAGHEGEGLLEPSDNVLQPVSEHAVDLIVRMVMANPGDITLIAVGPLTNVALALLREPRLAQELAGLMVMGGVVGGAGALHLPWVEHNFRCDPEAAAIVLASGVRLQIVPLDVTTKVCIRPEDVAHIRAAGDAYHAAVSRQVELYPNFSQRGWTFMHDPLAVAGVIQPDLLRWEHVRAVIETGGRHTAGQLLASAADRDTATAEIALGVDAARAEQFITGRIAG
jgi:purine nucleosidase